MYRVIDNKTNVYWPAIDALPDVTKSASECTRNRLPMVKDKVLENSNAQIGYGEASFSSVERIWEQFKASGITKHSSFLDIGSGFGKAVFHIAAKSKMRCYGLEVAAGRHLRSEQVMKELAEEYKKNSKLVDVFHRINLIHDDASRYNKYEFNGYDCSHIYCFNSVFSEVDN